MATVNEKLLWNLLQACAQAAPHPLYPVLFSRQTNFDRDLLDAGLDELRRRGLVQLTEWVKGYGQGCALTEAGQQALASGQLGSAPVQPGHVEQPDSLTHYERGEMIREAFLDPRPPYASRILLIANIAYFLFGAFVCSQMGGTIGEYIHGSGKTTAAVLIRLGVLHPALVFQDIGTRPQYERIFLHQLIQEGLLENRAHTRPQFERIFLCNFLHWGLLHLVMNMYFLAVLGPLIERVWGLYRFLAIYFVACLVSGCVVLQIVSVQQSFGLTAGASGGMYGLFTSLLVWFVLNKQYLPATLIEAWSRNFTINLVLLIGINFLPNVSWQGHFGGAVGGLLAALLLHLQRFSPLKPIRILALCAVPVVPVVFFVAMLWQVGWI